MCMYQPCIFGSKVKVRTFSSHVYLFAMASSTKPRRKVSKATTPEMLEAVMEELLTSFGTRDLASIMAKLKGNCELEKMSEFHSFFASLFAACETGKVPANLLEVAVASMDAKGRINFTKKPLHQFTERVVDILMKAASKYRNLKDNQPARFKRLEKLTSETRPAIEAVLGNIGDNPKMGFEDLQQSKHVKALQQSAPVQSQMWSGFQEDRSPLSYRFRRRRTRRLLNTNNQMMRTRF